VLAVLSVVTFGQRVAAVRRGAASASRPTVHAAPGGSEPPDEPRAERERGEAP